MCDVVLMVVVVVVDCRKWCCVVLDGVLCGNGGVMGWLGLSGDGVVLCVGLVDGELD